jgi:NAD(P)H-nitrite reductase large subunit
MKERVPHGDAVNAQRPGADDAAEARRRDTGDDLLVCRCEEVSRAEILAAIDEGITTMSGLRRRLRVGMGLCQGRTCGRARCVRRCGP